MESVYLLRAALKVIPHRDDRADEVGPSEACRRELQAPGMGNTAPCSRTEPRRPTFGGAAPTAETRETIQSIAVVCSSAPYTLHGSHSSKMQSAFGDTSVVSLPQRFIKVLSSFPDMKRSKHTGWGSPIRRANFASGRGLL